MKRKTDWLARSLLAGPYLCLVLSDKAFQVALDDLGQEKEGRPSWVMNSHSNATCHTMENASGELSSVVCLRGWEEKTGIEIAGLLLHEAVHIWQAFCRRIGEHDPSSEFEAYSIQWLAQQLWWSFQEQTK